MTGRDAPRATAGDAYPMEIATLAGVMDDLARRGFTEHFTLVNGRLRAVFSGTTFPADQLTISEYHRFEGISDPDDMAILYAIETPTGIRGTLVDAFGVYSDPSVSAFVENIPLGRTLQAVPSVK
jgi:hypothetical protein